uniref:MAM and LDL-receptor class A domain-containing protein 1-like n=1 Tax=Styela clava TaxID=7725 RepID=UPI001939D620|nr:MAM and LDL-receptor class A domain-containing protein 1-like [Styela clava]
MGVNDKNEAYIVDDLSGSRFFLTSPGIRGISGTVSFESEMNPKYFLRHYGYNLLLSPYEETNIFLEDATFWPRKDMFFQNYTVYESYNLPNHYIRHQAYRLKISQEDNTDRLHQDSSFKESTVLGEFDCNFEQTICGWLNSRDDDIDWTRHFGATTTEYTGPEHDHTVGNVCYNRVENMNSMYGLIDHPNNVKPPDTFYFGTFTEDDEDLCAAECGIQPLCAAYSYATNSGSSLWDNACIGRSDNPDLRVPESNHVSGFKIDCVGGYYMYMESSPPNVPNDIAWFVSPPLLTTGPICFRFWYLMHGSEVNYLRVYVKTEDTLRDPVWARHGTQGKYWLPAMINVNTRSEFHIVFEGTLGGYHMSDIAIDDVSKTDGTCPENAAFCDFERNDFCGWETDSSGDFLWSWSTLTTTSLDTGPEYDHSLQTAYGHYLYIESSSPRVAGDKARLYSPEFPGPDQATTKCLQFYHHMYGSTIGDLSVHIAHGVAAGPAIWHKSGNQGNIWLLGQAEIHFDGPADPYRIMFEGTVGTSFYGDIAIDDVLILNQACNILCDFDHATPCIWYNDKAFDDFDWSELRGKTLDPELGPTIDATTSTDKGYFLYLDQTGRKVNDKAWWVSETLSSSSPQKCLQFSYYMAGDDAGTLQVSEQSVNTGFIYYHWRLIGSQGNIWKSASVSISGTNHRRYIIEGVINSDGVQGSIALDDIKFTTTSCSLSPSSAQVTGQPQTTPEPVVTPSPIQYGSSNCTFEQDTCNWIGDPTADLVWTRNKGPGTTTGTGPTDDHTQGNENGYYMYVESSPPAQPGQKARIVGPLIQSNGVTNVKCFTFWYHMYGRDMGTLAVYMKTRPYVANPTWARKGHQSNRWQIAMIEIATDVDYQVFFILSSM